MPRHLQIQQPHRARQWITKAASAPLGRFVLGRFVLGRFALGHSVHGRFFDQIDLSRRSGELS
jgi:hypothetical protein